jgi:hypothetical protein
MATRNPPLNAKERRNPAYCFCVPEKERLKPETVGTVPKYPFVNENGVFNKVLLLKLSFGC